MFEHGGRFGLAINHVVWHIFPNRGIRRYHAPAANAYIAQNDHLCAQPTAFADADGARFGRAVSERIAHSSMVAGRKDAIRAKHDFIMDRYSCASIEPTSISDIDMTSHMDIGGIVKNDTPPTAEISATTAQESTNQKASEA